MSVTKSESQNPSDLNICVSDTITITESITNHKWWFNGMKKFTSVKIIPPYNREGLTDPD